MSIIKFPGQQATRSQQLLFANLIEKRSADEQIVVHHVTQDNTRVLQLEVERRCPVNGLAFQRIIL